jgi:hypothetical protein
MGGMHSRTYIQDKKRTVAYTLWSTAPIPKGAFPLFKDRAPFNPKWCWRSATLKSELAEYRLLVQLREDKPNYKAWLAAKIGKDWALIARLESHGHAGLHCHIQCVDQGISIGQIDPPNAISVPYWKAHHRRPNGLLSRSEAWHRALKFFRAQASAEVGLLGI